MKYEDINTSTRSTDREMPEAGTATILPYINVNESGTAAVDNVSADLKIEVLQNNLHNCLQIIDDEVMKGYIKHLDELKIVDPDIVIPPELDSIQFFKITELVYEQDEFSVHKLASVFHTLSGKPCTLVLMIKTRTDSNDLYLGVRSNDRSYSTGTMRRMLCQSLMGQFPGSKVETYTSEMLEEDIRDGERNSFSNSISAVTSVADFKQERNSVTNKDFIQGLEKYVYSIQGRNVTSVIIADNISHEELMHIKRDYEGIYSQLSPFAHMQYNFTNSNITSSGQTLSTGTASTQTIGAQSSVSESAAHQQTLTSGTNTSETLTVSEGTAETESRGTADTRSTTDTVSKSTTDSVTEGRSVGMSMGINAIGLSGNFSHSNTHSESRGTSHSKGLANTISNTLSHGINRTLSKGRTAGTSSSVSDSDTVTTGVQTGINSSESESVNYMNSDVFSEAFGNSAGVTLNAENRMITSILDRLNRQLERLDECESLGMWNLAAYFVGEVRADSETAANTYYSLVSGNRSGVERSAVNTWTGESDTERLKKYINNFVHPYFMYKGFGYGGGRDVTVTPTSMVSTNELAIHMALPRHSIKGLPVIEHAAFAQEILSNSSTGGINVGKIYHLGEIKEEPVSLDPDSLSMHTFITGSTGSGKSNAVYTILDGLRKRNVKFLVIEPAKGEYRHVFGNDSDVSVYGTNPAKMPLLRIDPFSFPEDIHILEHLDRLTDIFNVCWPMYAAMPAVLKNAIENSYEDCGWDLAGSVNEFGNDLFPTFSDVARNIKKIIDSSEYDNENKGAYKGSLLTRINSLTNGINGMIFTNNELSSEQLFDKNVIVDLSRVGSGETRSLIMGMLVLKLREYRMSIGKMNAPLEHITVLEEAHNLLRRTSGGRSSESADLVGKSVEMLTDSIAEMRTHGEGFIIADQAPGLLDMAAIRNTNTKIILRLPDEDDRNLVGRAANLDQIQITELSKLPRGVAAIYQNEWIQPVLCGIDRFDHDGREYVYEPTKELPSKTDNMRARISIADMLSTGQKNDADKVRCDIMPLLREFNMPSSIQAETLKLLLDPPENVRMTVLAPIICSLFPGLLDTMRAAYSETHSPREWTERIENALYELARNDIADRTRRDIIQCVVTQYLLCEKKDKRALENWSKIGGLK